MTEYVITLAEYVEISLINLKQRSTVKDKENQSGNKLRRRVMSQLGNKLS
jgi:hypothetical protein